MSASPGAWRFSFEGWPHPRLRISDLRTGEERFAMKRRALGPVMAALALVVSIAAGGSASAWAAMRKGWIGSAGFFWLAGLAGLGGTAAGILIWPRSPIVISTDPDGREPLLYVRERPRLLRPEYGLLAPDGEDRGRIRKEHGWTTLSDWRVFGGDGGEVLVANGRDRFFTVSRRYLTYRFARPGAEPGSAGRIESCEDGDWILTASDVPMDEGLAAALGALLIPGIGGRPL